ncbi:hypothetical protein FAI40_04535 [Acetobacteraceae bacterium]|nr:hypothetical protein FAI40_04535 [Acetobacteraceae bacterium]
MCRLFASTSRFLNGLNHMQKVTLRVSAGCTKSADYALTPAFEDYSVLADLQQLDSGSLQLSQNLSQQAEMRSAYLKGVCHALNRPLQVGGDRLILKDGSEWLITSLNEAWDGKEDWCKVTLTRQNPSPSLIKQINSKEMDIKQEDQLSK